MQIKEILTEMPSLTKGAMTSNILNMEIDDSILKKDYHKFGNIKDVDLYINLRLKDVLGIVDNSVILKLEFKPHITLPYFDYHDNVVQENKIIINPDYAGFGIASYVYELLVENGFSIISDDSHYDPGKALWKKLARTNNVFVADLQGNFTKYNGTNIPDEKIWSTDRYGHGTGIVLVMTNKQLAK